MQTTSLVSVLLGKTKVYHEKLVPFGSLEANRKVLRLDVSVDEVVSMHKLDSSKLSKSNVLINLKGHLPFTQR